MVVADPGGLTAVATVTVNVVNNAPVAVDDTVDVTAGDVTVDLLANDSDPDRHSIALASFPSQITFEDGRTATLTQDGTGSIHIDLDRRYVRGTTTFQYTIRDQYGLESAPATVTVVGWTFTPPSTEPPTDPPTLPPTDPPTTTTTEPTTTTTTEPTTTTTTTTEPPTTTTTTIEAPTAPPPPSSG